MHVLVVDGPARLDAAARSGLQPCAHPGFPTAVALHQLALPVGRRVVRSQHILAWGDARERPHMTEVAPTQPEVQPECIRHIHDVFQVSRVLVTERDGGFPKVEFTVALPEKERRRHKFVEHVLEAHSDFVLKVGVPTQLGLLGPVHDARIEPKFEVVLPRGECEVVIGI